MGKVFPEDFLSPAQDIRRSPRYAAGSAGEASQAEKPQDVGSCRGKQQERGIPEIVFFCFYQEKDSDNREKPAEYQCSHQKAVLLQTPEEPFAAQAVCENGTGQKQNEGPVCPEAGHESRDCEEKRKTQDRQRYTDGI